MAQLTCIVVTPEATVLEQKADFIALPLFDGEKGVSPSHSPMIGRLGFGELRLKTGGKLVRYYVDGGFVQVIGDTVSVLTSRAVEADKIDVEAAREQMESASKRPANTDELLAIRERAVSQARAQLQVAKR